MIGWRRLARRLGCAHEATPGRPKSPHSPAGGGAGQRPAPGGAYLFLPLAFALAACGGGGGGGAAPAVSQGGSPPPVESAYLLADFVAQDSNNQFVRVWDPANPSVAVENVRIAQSNGIAWMTSHLVFSDATAYDPSTRTVQTLGHAKVFYDNDGTVYVIDLRGGQSHAPVQLSSVTDARGMVRAIPLSADGAQAWVDVLGSASDWAVRTDMAATDAAHSIIALHAMRDLTTGLPQYLFTTFGSENGLNAIAVSYGVRDLDFNTIAVPAVDAMTPRDSWIAADPVQPGLAYLAIGQQMRALRWGAGGVSVDTAALHQFSYLSLAGYPVAADAGAVYVADGSTLVSVANAAVDVVATLALSPQSLTEAGDVIVAAELAPQSPSCCMRFEAANKATGAVTLSASGQDAMSVIGGGPLGVLYVDASTAAPGYLLASPSGSTLLASSGLANGVVWSASARLDQPPAPVAVLACTPDPTLATCVAGSLTQLDLATGATTALGSLGSGAPTFAGTLIEGVTGTLGGQTYLEAPGGLGSNEVDARDTWQLMPGNAGSLVRVTTYLP